MAVTTRTSSKPNPDGTDPAPVAPPPKRARKYTKKKNPNKTATEASATNNSSTNPPHNPDEVAVPPTPEPSEYFLFPPRH